MCDNIDNYWQYGKEYFSTESENDKGLVCDAKAPTFMPLIPELQTKRGLLWLMNHGITPVIVVCQQTAATMLQK